MPWSPLLPLLPLHGFPLPFEHGSPGGAGGGGGNGFALPWLPPFPLLPLHGLPLPFAQGSPSADFPLPLPLPEPWFAASTMAPLSTRALSAAGANFPVTTSMAACAKGDVADAH